MNKERELADDSFVSCDIVDMYIIHYATARDFCHEKDSCKNSCRYDLVNARQTIFDLLTMEDIPIHFFSITHEKLQSSCKHGCKCGKSICVSTVFSNGLS